MKKHLFALLALVLFVAGCPSNAPQVDASDFALDAAFDAAPHRVGSFNPTCTASGVPRVVGGVQQPACSLGAANQVLATNAGATDLVWTTPAAGSTPTGTGLPHIVGGVQNAAASLVVDADVSATAAIAGTKIAPNFGAQNVATTGTGTFQFVYASQVRSSGGSLYFPNPGVSAYTLVIDTTVQAGAPIVGYATVGSPYSVHGKTTVATVGSFTLAAADRSLDAIMFTGGTAGTVTFPAVGADENAYYKTVINTSGVTKTLSDGGASTPGIATALIGRFLFDVAGVHAVGPSVTYP